MTRPPYYHASLDFAELMREYPPDADYVGWSGQESEQGLTELQDRRFMALVSEGATDPFYSRLWAEQGVRSVDIRSLADYRELPVFTAEDLKNSVNAAPPYGEHQAAVPESFGRVPFKLGTSGGTTGKPRPTVFDPLSWEVQAIQAARALWYQGARPGDVVQIPRTNSLANAGWQYYHACHAWLGIMPLTTGSGVVTPSQTQLEHAATYGTNGWSARGEYLARLASVAQEVGFDLRTLPTRYLSATMGSDVEGNLRRRLEEAWGAPVYDNYGTNEIGLIAFECVAQDGLHVQEDSAFVEVLSAETLEPVGYGEEGVLVVTSLHRHLPRIIRFNTNDLFSLRPAEPCECGLVTKKLSHFLGRADEMIKLRGQNIYPRSAQQVISQHSGANGEYVCIVYRDGDPILGTTEMTVRAERTSVDIDPVLLREELERSLRSFWGARVQVEVVDPNVLAPQTGLGGEGKVRRLIDERK